MVVIPDVRVLVVVVVVGFWSFCLFAVSVAIYYYAECCRYNDISVSVMVLAVIVDVFVSLIRFVVRYFFPVSPIQFPVLSESVRA